MADRADERLDGWKAIARHFGRDERTVKRWEARGLPVRRVPGGGPRAAVYAHTGELGRWLNAQGPLPEEAEVPGADLGPAADPDPSRPVIVERAPAPPPRPARRWRVPLAVGASLALVGAVAAARLGGRSYPGPQSTAAFDPQARDHYLSGMAAWRLRTPASLAQARDDFGAAIAREPGYAAAYAGLANTYLLLREFGSMPDAEAYARADTAADTALKLDPGLAAAHRAKAFVLYWSKHDSPAAFTEFDKAAALAPNEALTWHWRATALQNDGRLPEALATIEHARALDPTSTAILADEGLLLHFAGRTGEARVRLARVVSLDPTNVAAHRYLAAIARSEGRMEDYRRETHLSAEMRGMAASDKALTIPDAGDSTHPVAAR